MIIILNFKFARLPKYNNVLKSSYHKIDTMSNTPFWGKGGLVRCISQFILPSKQIREKYPNCPKTHKLENPVLIAEEEKKIQINSGLSNVCMFYHADFKGVEFYTARKYVHLKKEGREEDFFVSDEYEEDNEVLLVSELPLLVEHRVCGVESFDLPCLASGRNSNLSSGDMADLRRQGIAVYKNNDPIPENIPVPGNIPFKKLEEENSWRSVLGEPKYGPGSEPQWKAGRTRYPAFYKALLEENSRKKRREMLVEDQRSTRTQ